MENKKSTKKNKKTQEQIWTENLNSSNDQIVKDTIQEIRQFGNVKILPTIIENYSKQKNPSLRKELEKLLTDIKRKEAAQILFKYVLDKNYSHIKKDLLAILWQTRLDFSPFIPELIQIFINEPFETAFEAFTIIEYMDEPIDQQIASDAIAKLKDSLRTIDEQKKFLLVDLVNILKKWA